VPYSRSRPLFGRELKAEEKCVQGTLVIGLTESDLDVLDVFEGDVCLLVSQICVPKLILSRKEYVRERVAVHPLESLAGLSSEPSTFTAESLIMAAPPSELAGPVEAQTYVYNSLSDLKAELWSFDGFVKNNAWKWVGSEGNREVYTEVDRRRGVPCDVSHHAV
jgi:hypothetical protein